MRRFLIAAFLILCSTLARAAETGQVVATCGTPTGLTYSAPGLGNFTVDQTGKLCINSNSAGPGEPQAGAVIITGNNTGTTGAVVGTLAAVVGKTTYICGFNVSAIGGTASVCPVTVAGLVGSSQVYQCPVNSAAGALVIPTQNFSPCIPASAANTAITVTTTANATATAVDVNSWGFTQ